MLPTNPYSARNWADFGVELGKDDPCLGAIAVFVRDGGGHVGFYLGEDDTHVHVLGGNQSNSVTVARIEMRRLLTYTFPKTYKPLGTRIYLTAKGVPVTANEA